MHITGPREDSNSKFESHLLLNVYWLHIIIEKLVEKILTLTSLSQRPPGCLQYSNKNQTRNIIQNMFVVGKTFQNSIPMHAFGMAVNRMV